MNEIWHGIGHRTGMVAILAIITLIIAWTVERRSRNPVSKISLDDLLLGDDGKISKAACVMFGSFALTTWAIVYLTLSDKLTEGYFGAYIAAWVAPVIAKILKGPEVQPQNRTSTVVATETVTK